MVSAGAMDIRFYLLHILVGSPVLHRTEGEHLTTTVNYAHYSDKLVVLSDKGSMVFCGPYDNWSEKQGGTQIRLADSQPSDSLILGVAADDNSSLASVDIPQKKQDAAQRQSGDYTVWSYYAKSIGMFPLIVAAIFTAAAAVSFHFQSESQYKHTYFPSMFTFSNQWKIEIWIDWNTRPNPPNTETFIAVFGLLTLGTVLWQSGLTAYVSSPRKSCWFELI
jgi:hypothetical protein